MRRFGLISFFLLFTQVVWTSDVTSKNCVIIIDAGSSGTRLHLYSYQETPQHLPEIKEIWSNKINPGLNNLSFTQSSIDHYLDRLFKNIPPLPSTPVYFYATAGMRMIPQPQQEIAYTLVRHWFEQYANFDVKDIKTIPGKEEGIYGWLAVNYQLGTLQSEKQVGVIDVGGASTQISFPVKNSDRINQIDLSQFDLFDHHYSVFVHSFLGLGQNEASHQLLAENDCFIKNYQIDDNSYGEGNIYRCEEEIKPLIEMHHVKKIVHPGMENKVNESWYALGAIPEVITRPPFLFTDNQYTSQGLISQANTQVCQEDWSKVSQTYAHNAYIYGYCLFPAYYYELMVDGYGFDAEQEINILGNSVGDWTVGVLLWQKAHPHSDLKLATKTPPLPSLVTNVS